MAAANASAVGSSTRRPVSPCDHRFERAAAAQRDDRPAAGLGFERDDAEIFFARQQDDGGAAVEVADVVVGGAPEELRRAVREPASRAARSGPSPTIFSGTPRQPAGVDREVDALVGHQRGHDQSERLRIRGVRAGRNRCRRADTPQSPRDYSIGGSCPQHNERSRHSGPPGPPCRGPTGPGAPSAGA